MQFTSRGIMITKHGQHIHLLERVTPVGSYHSQSGSDVIGTQCPDFDKYSYIHFWWGYGHQMSAAGTPLGEESSGHLSPGTSDVITMQPRDWQIQITSLQKSLLSPNLDSTYTPSNLFIISNLSKLTVLSAFSFIL